MKEFEVVIRVKETVNVGDLKDSDIVQWLEKRLLSNTVEVVVVSIKNK